jgi:hypothetical protein
MRLAEEQPEFVLGGLKACPLFQELMAGAIDVKVSMDMAERNGSVLRRQLRSAEFFSDSAICLRIMPGEYAGIEIKALLVSVTCCDQRVLSV